MNPTPTINRQGRGNIRGRSASKRGLGRVNIVSRAVLSIFPSSSQCQSFGSLRVIRETCPEPVEGFVV